MRANIGITILLLASTSLMADTITMSGLGNGQGWNDGQFYTGYLTLTTDGADYQAICIDALHEAGGSWDGMILPLTDSQIPAVMLAYFGVTDPAQFWPGLYADAVGYTILTGVGSDEGMNNQIQHDVWAQFDPEQFTDDGSLAASGSFNVDLTGFALAVDSGYATGTDLRQAFLVTENVPVLTPYDPPSTPIEDTPEPSSALLIGGTMVGFAALCRYKGILRSKGHQRC